MSPSSGNKSLMFKEVLALPLLTFSIYWERSTKPKGCLLCANMPSNSCNLNLRKNLCHKLVLCINSLEIWTDKEHTFRAAPCKFTRSKY